MIPSILSTERAGITCVAALLCSTVDDAKVGSMTNRVSLEPEEGD
jgi:hypothetical protein